MPPPFPSDLQQSMCSIYTDKKHIKLTGKSLARKWNIELKCARQTIDVTTQAGVRSALHPLTRWYQTDLTQLYYRRLNNTFYTDTVFASTKSIRQNTCVQVWTNGKGYLHLDRL